MKYLVGLHNSNGMNTATDSVQNLKRLLLTTKQDDEPLPKLSKITSNTDNISEIKADIPDRVIQENNSSVTATDEISTNNNSVASVQDASLNEIEHASTAQNKLAKSTGLKLLDDDDDDVIEVSFSTIQSVETKFDVCGICKKTMQGRTSLLLGCLHSFCSDCLLQKKNFFLNPSSSKPVKNMGNTSQSSSLVISEVPDNTFESLAKLKQYISENSAIFDKLVIKCCVCDCITRAKVIVKNQFLLNSKQVENDINQDDDIKFCTSCEEKQIAIRFCKDCKEYLCEECVNAHTRVKLTKEHELQVLNTANDEKVFNEQQIQSRYCKIHPNEELKLFCESCNVLTCRDCQLDTHRNHKYAYVEEAANSYIKILETMRHKLSEKKYFLDQASTSIKKHLNDSCCARDKANEEVVKFHNDLHDLITKRCQTFLEKISAVSSHRHRKLNYQLMCTERLRGAVDHCVNFIDFASKKQNYLALLGVKHMILEYMTTVMRQKFTATPVTSSDIVFAPNKDTFSRISEKLGTLLWGQTIPLTSSSSASLHPSEQIPTSSQPHSNHKVHSSVQNVVGGRTMHYKAPTRPSLIRNRSSSSVRPNNIASMNPRIPQQPYVLGQGIPSPNEHYRGTRMNTPVHSMPQQQHQYQVQNSPLSPRTLPQMNRFNPPHSTSARNVVLERMPAASSLIQRTVSTSAPTKLQTQAKPPQVLKSQNSSTPMTTSSHSSELKPFVVNVVGNYDISSALKQAGQNPPPNSAQPPPRSHSPNTASILEHLDEFLVKKHGPRQHQQQKQSSFLAQVAAVTQQQVLPELAPSTTGTEQDTEITNKGSSLERRSSASSSSIDSGFISAPNKNVENVTSSSRFSPPPLIDLPVFLKMDDDDEPQKNVKPVESEESLAGMKPCEPGEVIECTPSPSKEELVAAMEPGEVIECASSPPGEKQESAKPNDPGEVVEYTSRPSEEEPMTERKPCEADEPVTANEPDEVAENVTENAQRPPGEEKSHFVKEEISDREEEISQRLLSLAEEQKVIVKQEQVDSIAENCGGEWRNSSSPEVDQKFLYDENADERTFDPNEDWCAVCNNGGDLLCCDTCPKVFHHYCHIPEIIGTPQGTWQCTFCRDISKAIDNESKYPKRKRAVGLNLQELKLCEKLLLELYCHPQSMPFHHPVRASVPNYYKVIKEPIDLSKIKKRMQPSHFSHYQCEKEFLKDLHLMFTNCFYYNSENSTIKNMGKKLQKFFLERVKEKFPHLTEFINELMTEQATFLIENPFNLNAIVEDPVTKPIKKSTERLKSIPYESDAPWEPDQEEGEEEVEDGEESTDISDPLSGDDFLNDDDSTGSSSPIGFGKKRSGVFHIK